MIRNQSVYKGLYYIALDFLSWDITKPDRYTEFDNNFNRLCFRLWNIDKKSDRILHLTQENMSFWLVMPRRIPYHQNLRGWFWLKLIIYKEIFCSSRQYTLRINIIYIYNITKRCLQYLRYNFSPQHFFNSISSSKQRSRRYGADSSFSQSWFCNQYFTLLNSTTQLLRQSSSEIH